MKIFWILLLAAAVCAVPLAAQLHEQPIPPGLREAESPQNQIHFPSPEFGPQAGITPQKLTQEADKLNGLTIEVKKEIAMVNQGELPRDLPKNLKVIEKLAHRLRSQLKR
jgi:hypothetical protein